MHDRQRFAIVITHMGRRKDMVEMPWLETQYHIDESDWMVLSGDGWRALANGESTIWEALQRKLLVGCFVNHPQLIVVIGHPPEDGEHATVEQRQEEVRRIVERVRSLLLPAGVMGIWTDERGVLQDVLEPAVRSEREHPELQLMH
jgi:hypothetical protein